MKRVPALDGVRALAILLVIAHHVVNAPGVASADSGLERALAYTLNEGWVGVDLFFALSGYLITGILLRTRGQEGYFKNFMMRRVLRIFPLYYLFLVVFFVILPRVFPADPELASLPAQQGWYWSYLPNLHIFLDGDWSAHYTEHAWSLAIEEQFYLVWPAIVALCSRRTLLWVCALGVPASLALRVLLVAGGAGRAEAFVLPPAHLDGLMLGAILAILEPALHRDVRRARRLLVGLVAAGVLALGVLLVLPIGYDMKHDALSVTVWSVVFTGFIGWLLVADPKARLVRALGSWPLSRIGVLSYGIYLWHQPIFRIVAAQMEGVRGPALRHWGLLAVVAGGLSFAVASLLYEGFEMRFLELKRYFDS